MSARKCYRRLMHASSAKALPQPTDPALDAARDLCDRNGAQLTPLRRSVLALVLESAGPATAYQLLDRLKLTRPGAAPPTIYRALDFLVEQKLIHRIERLNAFIPCTGATHAHPHAAQFLICTSCGAVAEIEDASVTKALAHAAAAQGFRPAQATVELNGTCAVCTPTA